MSCVSLCSRLQSSIQLVQSYEIPSLQQKALACIPLQRLLEKAVDNIEANSIDGLRNRIAQMNFQDVQPLLQCPVLLQEAFLQELLVWFKTDFFTWFSTPNCPVCARQMSHEGNIAPTMEDVLWGAQRVEYYTCATCTSSHRFPRYNQPEKLLETRTGRCGEWANCFTLLCRSLGWDTRYVMDWTDHVWTEVYSEHKQRWIHCDSCEAISDKPLLYERGWGKKLTYVIAFSRDQVQDVTWRYSAQHRELLRRRTEVSEAWLLSKCTSLSTQLQAHVNGSTRDKLTLRLFKELCEFLAPPVITADLKLPGRISGEEEWRKARGEIGAIEVAAWTWRPNLTEIKKGYLHVGYSSSLDNYVRHAEDNPSTSCIAKWQKGVYKYECIARKVEYDWKMAYLARTEGATVGSITWRVDVTDSGKTIGEVRVNYPQTVYHNAAIQWRLCADEQCEILPAGQMEFLCESFRGTKTLTLTAVLRGGQGDSAWQHAQVARQNLEEQLYTFSLYIQLQT
nr:EOG090X06HD [Lepidurus arcticus]